MRNGSDRFQYSTWFHADYRWRRFIRIINIATFIESDLIFSLLLPLSLSLLSGQIDGRHSNFLFISFKTKRASDIFSGYLHAARLHERVHKSIPIDLFSSAMVHSKSIQINGQCHVPFRMITSVSELRNWRIEWTGQQFDTPLLEIGAVGVCIGRVIRRFCDTLVTLPAFSVVNVFIKFSAATRSIDDVIE